MFLYIKGTALKEPYMAEGAGFWGVLESLYLSMSGSSRWGHSFYISHIYFKGTIFNLFKNHLHTVS